jgi:hypothetical protein
MSFTWARSSHAPFCCSGGNAGQALRRERAAQEADRASEIVRGGDVWPLDLPTHLAGLRAAPQPDGFERVIPSEQRGYMTALMDGAGEPFIGCGHDDAGRRMALGVRLDRRWITQIAVSALLHRFEHRPVSVDLPENHSHHESHQDHRHKTKYFYILRGRQVHRRSSPRHISRCALVLLSI